MHIGWSTYDRFAGKKGEKGKGKNKMENFKRSVGRSRSNMRRDMLSLGADRMWTFTYASNMQDYEKTLDHMNEFVRRIKRIYPHFAGVGVIEPQKRGALHWHIAVSGRYEHRDFQRTWWEVIGEQSHVFYSYKPDGKGNAYTKLASYMSKYMGKGLGDGEAEKHRYHRYGNVNRPQRERYSIPLSAPRDTEMQMAIEAGQAVFGSGVRFWVSPICSEGKHGYIVIERSQHQPEGGEEECTT